MERVLCCGNLASEAGPVSGGSRCYACAELTFTRTSESQFVVSCLMANYDYYASLDYHKANEAAQTI